MTVADRVPTLGDLCDLKLVTDNNDPFALARLLQRWIMPEPTIEQVRAMTMLDLQTHFEAIAAHVHEHSIILSADPGKRKH